jgi:uncharacterized protein (TIGR04255 family)
MTHFPVYSRPLDLPDFASPPVVEVALGVQFASVPQLRPLELGPLRDRWRGDFPNVQELPPLPSTIEGPQGSEATVQLVVGPMQMSRLWFVSKDGTELIQLQPDRLVVNWRAGEGASPYPRYPHVRSIWERAWSDLTEFMRERDMGELRADQVEVSYINAVPVGSSGQGELERLLRVWQPFRHHLGAPEQGRALMVFGVPGISGGPVRMHVAAETGRTPSGEGAWFLTITVRGGPSSEDERDVVRFLDQAHDHIVHSFAELTTEEMHKMWERKT